MNTPMVLTSTRDRKPVSALRKTMIAALIAYVLVGAYTQVVVVHTLIPPLAVIMLVAAAVAAVCATRWRWAGLLCAIWCVLSSMPPALPAYVYNLTHPTAYNPFVTTLVMLAVALIACVAGIRATAWRTQAADAASLPHWFPGFLVGVATFALGASLVAAIPQPAARAGVSATTLAGLPALTTANHQFAQREIKVKVGETVALRLHNSDGTAHSFDVDAFNVHVPMSTGQDALALFRPAKPGTYTFYCSLPGHANLATGTGMIGKIVVTP
jgi:heme/copper-type cytochrome/quinol oxidase subunit 2